MTSMKSYEEKNRFWKELAVYMEDFSQKERIVFLGDLKQK